MSNYAVVTFYSTHHALKAERILKEEIKIFVVPVPRSISSNCGISIRFPANDSEKVEEILRENHVGFEGIFPWPE
ncbi:DUF3343 domain-containing protein [Candidatus Oleimmundimicrobium sp.]|uniref:DUF3343 domain-containing protein n=1 Tax=Candidatus Oleimmundimicrobium sp. TaxID=3060597 RepID=UPI00271B08A8|nr:DUF3343 domain-containing protein [Candidatus Oleimmundimicrobium sp.]MDO8886453.1 DUF3343 domain-containing protein [Candidatus Oleimmundimicrobium sp.]